LLRHQRQGRKLPHRGAPRRESDSLGKRSARIAADPGVRFVGCDRQS
jgi:hypothetical protein